MPTCAAYVVRRPARFLASALLATLLLMICVAESRAKPMFQAPFYGFGTSGHLISVAVGDLDSDGHLDLAAANHGNWPDYVGSISIRLGQGDGTFRLASDVPDPSPVSVILTDLNLDGRSDLVVVDPDAVAVFLGNGDGTFGARQVIAAGFGAAVGDVNEDGKPDIAFASKATNRLSVLPGNGDGTFGSPIEGDAWAPAAMRLVDVNADGHLDFVDATYGAECKYDDCNVIFVSLGRGDGTFAPSQGFGGGISPFALDLADFNRDGHVDIAYATAGERSEQVLLLLGNGDGTFGAGGHLPTGANPLSIAAADFNGDGTADLATADYGADPDYDSNSISVFLGKGDGSFETLPRMLVGSDPVSVAAGDLNEDGRPDLVMAYGAMLASLIGNGDGTFGSKDSYETDFDLHAVEVADFNRDGLPDIVQSDWHSVALRLGIGSGQLGSRAVIESAHQVRELVVADWNGDHAPDIAFFDGDNASLRIDLGNGDGTFTSKEPLTGLAPLRLAAADLNGDGRSDLAMVTAQNALQVLIGRGDGTFDPTPRVTTLTRLGIPAFGDFNGDGELDLAIAYSTARYAERGGIALMPGNGDGTFGPSREFRGGRDAYAVTLCDVNADGKLDVLAGFEDWENPLESLVVFLGNGDGTLAPKQDFYSGPRSDALATGDFDLDGRLDVAAANFDFESTISVLLGKGDGTFSPRFILGNRGWPLSMAVADMNGDGWPDLVAGVHCPYDVAGRPFANHVSILFNNGGPRVSFGFRPNTLNLASKGPWITASLQPEKGFSPADIEVGSLRLNDAARADDSGSLGDLNHDGIPDLTVRFNRSELVRTLSAGENVVHVVGKVHAQTFLTTGSLRVLRGGRPAEASEEPASARSLALAIRGTTPNPASGGRVRIQLELPDAGPARLELLDLAGRLVSSRDVGRFGPGAHDIELAENGRLRPGIYFVRLMQGGATARSRIVVLP